MYRIVSISCSGQYQTIICGSNKDDENSRTIYISSDYGNTWTKANSGLTARIYGLSVSSTGQYQTVCVNGNYIYTSSDYGNTWTARNTSTSLAWTSVSISSAGQYQSAAVNGGSIYRGFPNGNSWLSKTISKNWYTVSISQDMPIAGYNKNNEPIYFCLADLDKFNINLDLTNGYEFLQNVYNNDLTTRWNPISGSSPYKIRATFSEPVLIKKLYYRIFGDITHSPTSITIFNDINNNDTTKKIYTYTLTDTNKNNRDVQVLDINLSSQTYTTDFTIVFEKTTQYQLWLYFLSFDVSPLSPPAAPVINSTNSSNNSIDLNFSVNNMGSPITSYRINSYFDGGCKYREISNLTTNIDGTLIYTYPNLTSRKNYTGDKINLPTNCTKENYDYVDILSKPILSHFSNKPIKENYIFTLNATNDIGKGPISFTTEDVLPLVPVLPPTSSTGPTGPNVPVSPTPTPTPTPTSSTSKYLIISVVIILIILIIIAGFFLLKKN